MANQAGSNLRHIRERELSRRNRLRRPASFKVGDLVLVHHSQLPSWPRNCLRDPYFGPYRIIRIDGSRIHVRCSPRLGGELLCAPKQLTHYHSPMICPGMSGASATVYEHIDLENAASPEEAEELEEVTGDEMAVDGYYVVAGIARHEYKQGWKFLTLWDGYGLSEATWEPMSAFIQPDGNINPIFRSYNVENNEGQLLTRAEPLSQRKKKNQSPCACLFTVPNRTADVAGFKRRWYTQDIPSSLCQSPSDHSCRSIGSLGGTLPPHQGRSNTEDGRNTTRPLILFAAQWSVRPIAPACHHTFSAQCSTRNAPTRWTRYPWGQFSPGCPPPYDHLNSGSPERAGLRELIPLRSRLTVEALYSPPPPLSNLPGAVSTLVLIARPTQCVPGQVQDSCRAPVTVSLLTPTLSRVRHSRHLHIRCLRSTAPALAMPCSPMPMVTSVIQMAAYQVCSPQKVCALLAMWCLGSALML